MRIKEIDVMKSFAILGVILVHTAQKFKAMPEWLSLICCFGQMGVQIFFMFSAYGLCLSKNKEKSYITKDYYLKRILRIVPGYWIGILLYELVFIIISSAKLPVVIGTNTKPSAIAVNVLLLNNLFVNGNNDVVPGGWSISCLWLFYLLFPFIWKLINKIQKDKYKIALLSAGILLAPIVFIIIYMVSRGDIVVENNSFLYFFFGNQIGSFLMGVLLFIIEKKIKNSRMARILLMLFSVLFFAAAFFIFAKGYWWSYVTVTFLSAAGSACVYMLLRKHEFNYNALFAGIGKRTYAMFLVHPLFAYYGVSYARKVIVHMDMKGQSVLFFAVCYILVVLLSYISGGLLQKIADLPVSYYKKKNKAS